MKSITLNCLCFPLWCDTVTFSSYLVDFNLFTITDSVKKNRKKKYRKRGGGEKENPESNPFFSTVVFSFVDFPKYRVVSDENIIIVRT